MNIEYMYLNITRLAINLIIYKHLTFIVIIIMYNVVNSDVGFFSFSMMVRSVPQVWNFPHFLDVLQ